MGGFRGLADEHYLLPVLNHACSVGHALAGLPTVTLLMYAFLHLPNQTEIKC